jgi:hypothetical protein
MVVADRPRGEAGEEVEEVGAGARVVEPRAMALLEVEDERIAVGELVSLEGRS